MRNLISLAVVAALAAGPGAAQSSDPLLQIATTFLETAPSDPVTGYPGYGEGERLLAPMPGGQKPWLATAVEMVDPQHWRITLRPGVRFANGAPMNAGKVAEWLHHELTNDYDPGIYAEAQVAAEGDLVVTVAFPAPQPGFGWDLSYFALPVYDLAALKSIDGDFSRLPGLGIFTGPYQLVQADPGRWRYAPNPHYWGGPPALEGIERVLVSDEQAALSAIETGEVDMIDLVSPRLKPVVEARPDLHFVTGSPGQHPEFLALRPNLGRGPWADLAVRQALALLIDPETLSARGSFGVFPPMRALTPLSAPAGAQILNVPDPQRAARLLEEAGWQVGPDGVRAKGGQRLEGVILTAEPLLADVGVVFVQSAKAAGFALGLQIAEAQTVYDAVSTGQFDLSLSYGQTTGYDGDPAALCDMFDPVVAYAASTSVQDSTIRAACDRLAQTRAPADVAEIISTVQARNAEALFVLPLTGFVPAAVTNAAWRDYRPDYWFSPIDARTAATAP